MAVLMLVGMGAAVLSAVRNGLNKNYDAMLGWITASILFLSEVLDYLI